MKYFEPPYTKQNLKKQFRDHSKKLHPDKNISGSSSNPEEFLEMMKQYKFLTTPQKKTPKKKPSGHRKKNNSTFVKNIIINIDSKTIDKIIKKFLR